MKKTKRQHYVPKAYLNFFAEDGKSSKMLYVLHFNDKQLKYLSVDDVCVRKDLYEQKTNNPHTDETIYLDRNSIENSFIGIEGDYSETIKRIKNNCDQKKELIISEKDRDVLSLFMALNIFRHPIFVELAKKYGCSQIDKESIQMQNISSFAFLKFFLSMDSQAIYIPAMKDAIKDKQAFVLKSKHKKFITSDSPIVNLYGDFNQVDFDMIGFPITPELFFAFSDTPENLNNRIIAIDDKFVDYLNNKQISSHSANMIISKEINNIISVRCQL